MTSEPHKVHHIGTDECSLRSSYDSTISHVPPMIKQSGVGTEQKIIDGLKGVIHSDVLLLVGACRSGTTATSIALCQPRVRAGVTQTFNRGMDQVLKGFIRRLYDEYTFSVDAGETGSCLVLKETLGPHYPAETQWNPVRCLLDSNIVTREKMKVLLNLRNPVDTWISWKKCFGEHTSVEIFLEAMQGIVKISDFCTQQGITLQTLVVDDFVSQQEAQLSSILQKLRLSFHPEMIQWLINQTDNQFFDRSAALNYYSGNTSVQDVYSRLVEQPLLERDTFGYRKPSSSLLSEDDRQKIQDSDAVQQFLKLIENGRQTIMRE